MMLRRLPAEMVCIGTGGGPKNVLARHPGGVLVVYSYPAWKWKVSKR